MSVDLNTFSIYSTALGSKLQAHCKEPTQLREQTGHRRLCFSSSKLKNTRREITIKTNRKENHIELR